MNDIEDSTAMEIVSSYTLAKNIQNITNFLNERIKFLITVEFLAHAFQSIWNMEQKGHMNVVATETIRNPKKDSLAIDLAKDIVNNGSDPYELQSFYFDANDVERIVSIDDSWKFIVDMDHINYHNKLVYNAVSNCGFFLFWNHEVDSVLVKKSSWKGWLEELNIEYSYSQKISKEKILEIIKKYFSMDYSDVAVEVERMSEVFKKNKELKLKEALREFIKKNSC